MHAFLITMISFFMVGQLCAMYPSHNYPSQPEGLSGQSFQGDLSSAQLPKTIENRYVIGDFFFQAGVLYVGVTDTQKSLNDQGYYSIIGCIPKGNWFELTIGRRQPQVMTFSCQDVVNRLSDRDRSEFLRSGLVRSKVVPFENGAESSPAPSAAVPAALPVTFYSPINHEDLRQSFAVQSQVPAALPVPQQANWGNGNFYAALDQFSGDSYPYQEKQPSLDEAVARAEDFLKGNLINGRYIRNEGEVFTVGKMGPQVKLYDNQRHCTINIDCVEQRDGKYRADIDGVVCKFSGNQILIGLSSSERQKFWGRGVSRPFFFPNAPEVWPVGCKSVELQNAGFLNGVGALSRHQRGVESDDSWLFRFFYDDQRVPHLMWGELECTLQSDGKWFVQDKALYYYEFDFANMQKENFYLDENYNHFREYQCFRSQPWLEIPLAHFAPGATPQTPVYLTPEQQRMLQSSTTLGGHQSPLVIVNMRSNRSGMGGRQGDYCAIFANNTSGPVVPYGS